MSIYAHLGRKSHLKNDASQQMDCLSLDISLQQYNTSKKLADSTVNGVNNQPSAASEQIQVGGKFGSVWIVNRMVSRVSPKSVIHEDLSNQNSACRSAVWPKTAKYNSVNMALVIQMSRG